MLLESSGGNHSRECVKKAVRVGLAMLGPRGDDDERSARRKQRAAMSWESKFLWKENLKCVV